MRTPARLISRGGLAALALVAVGCGYGNFGNEDSGTNNPNPADAAIEATVTIDVFAPLSDAAPTCASPRVMCGASCVDTATDGAHCGGCNNVCGTGNVCRGSMCVPAVLMADAGMTPTVDTGRPCAIPCRGAFACVDGTCESRCAPRCGSSEECLANPRTGEWACVSVVPDAGMMPMPDVQMMPPPDSGPPCISDQPCTHLCPDPTTQTGRTTCSPMLGCLCVSRPIPDAGTPTPDVVIPTDMGPPPCSFGETRCVSGCADLQTSRMNCGLCGNDCGAGNRCRSGRCERDCAPGMTECAGACVDMASTVAHCGRCNNACTARANAMTTCSASVCMYTCMAGFADVNGDMSDGCEVNLMSDVRHCGAVRNACPATVMNGSSACVTGTCRIGCNAGFADVDGNPANGCEVNLMSDVRHCGAVRNVCAAGMACCSGLCVNTASDNGHCGMCGNACTGSSVCALGRCTGLCPLSWPMCGGSCVDQSSSVAHCGRCGNECVAPSNAAAACNAGSCGMGRCNLDFADCDGNAANGCEVNVTRDVLNCGACGNRCPSGPNSTATCSYWSGCGLVCTAGFGNCNRTASDGCEVNLNSDRNNCGACGWACASGESCDAGRCMPTCSSPRRVCFGVCTDVTTDPTNCGDCSILCPVGRLNTTVACRSSTCVSTCNSGFGECDGTASTGCETDLRSSVVNCGGCGVRCAAGQFCSAGVCTPSVSADAGTPDAGADVVGVVDATPDAGTDAGMTTDVMIAQVSCPSGQTPRTIIYRIPNTVPPQCAQTGVPTTGRPVLWGGYVGEPVGVAPGVTVQPVGTFGNIPLYHAPVQTPPSALQFTNTAAWSEGNFVDMSARCGNSDATYYEAFGFWLPYPTLAAAGGSFIVNGVERAGDVVRFGNKMRFILGPACVPAP